MPNTPRQAPRTTGVRRAPGALPGAPNTANANAQTRNRRAGQVATPRATGQTTPRVSSGLTQQPTTARSQTATSARQSGGARDGQSSKSSKVPFSRLVALTKASVSDTETELAKITRNKKTRVEVAYTTFKTCPTSHRSLRYLSNHCMKVICDALAWEVQWPSSQDVISKHFYGFVLRWNRFEKLRQAHNGTLLIEDTFLDDGGFPTTSRVTQAIDEHLSLQKTRAKDIRRQAQACTKRLNEVVPKGRFDYDLNKAGNTPWTSNSYYEGFAKVTPTRHERFAGRVLAVIETVSRDDDNSDDWLSSNIDKVVMRWSDREANLHYNEESRVLCVSEPWHRPNHVLSQREMLSYVRDLIPEPSVAETEESYEESEEEESETESEEETEEESESSYESEYEEVRVRRKPRRSREPIMVPGPPPPPLARVVGAEQPRVTQYEVLPDGRKVPLTRTHRITASEERDLGRRMSLDSTLGFPGSGALSPRLSNVSVVSHGSYAPPITSTPPRSPRRSGQHMPPSPVPFNRTSPTRYANEQYWREAPISARSPPRRSPQRG